MNREGRNFDDAARSWDTPGRIKLAEDVAAAISQAVPLRPDMAALDFGCGTGLLTLKILPHVRSIVGADSSQGMLEVFRTKIEGQDPSRVRALFLDPARDDSLTGSFDLIVSSMTLHHVRDIQTLLDRFFRITAPGGHLCIADLDPDEGKFHEDGEGVFHAGFERSSLRRAFEDSGFEDVSHRTASGVVKFVVGEGMTVFTVFLMTGRKRRT